MISSCSQYAECNLHVISSCSQYAEYNLHAISSCSKYAESAEPYFNYLLLTREGANDLKSCDPCKVSVK